MIVIKCAQCKRKIFKYRKIGKGRILRCYKDRIVQYYIKQNHETVQCSCGQTIGLDEGKWIKMKQNAFEFTGSVDKK